MEQTIFNWLLSGVGSAVTILGTVMLRRIHGDIDESRKSAIAITQSIADLRVEIATIYITRDEVRELMREIKDGIHRIESRLEQKADRRRDP